MQIGSIPTNIVYIYSNVRTIDKQEVYPAFISDANNKKTIETGKKWADWKNYYKPDEQHGIFEFETSNEPITKIQILSLEKRGRGGRAYKVLVHSNKLFYVDLREDVLMDVILEVGIDKKGFLKGSFIWSRVGSEMKLIRVGSKLHKEMIESTSLAKQKITKSKLEVGGVYSNKHYTGVYCGNFTTISYSVKDHYVPDPNNRYCQINKIERSFKLLENIQLWADCSFYKDGKTHWAFKTEVFPSAYELISDFNFLIENQEYYWDFKFSKNRLVKEKLNQLLITKSIYDSLKIISTNVIGRSVKVHSNSDVAWALSCEIIHLTPVNSKLSIHPEFQKYPELVSIVNEYNSKLEKSKK